MEYNNSKRNILLPLIIAIAVVLGLLLGKTIHRTRHIPPTLSFDKGNLSDDKLIRVLSLIYGEYVDRVELDSVEEKIIPMLLESLDPHSGYIPASDLTAVTEPLEGHFDGIGVTFNMITDTILVINVIPGGPSAKAGVQNGDRIITVNDSLVAGVNIRQDDIVKMLRGPRGTEVNLGVKRGDLAELLAITVERGVIPIKSVDAGFMIDSETGYIKLSLFSRNSHSEIVRIVKEMEAQGMKNLIFDLRGNSGGLLDQAILIANEFLPDDTLIVYAEGRARRRVDQYSNGKGRLQDVNAVILIDEGSASASEIVAGALQDNDRGTIIGRRTFGKGLVQEQIPFDDGSALRLTVARYYTPAGRSIQKPYDQGKDEYYGEIMNRYHHSELFSADSIRFPDSLRYITPKGRVVYGGGGIMPDIFVPIDTTALPAFVRKVLGQNVLFRYTLEYADKHRKALNEIESIEQLDLFFSKDPRLVSDFMRYAASKGFVPTHQERVESEDLLESELKAYIGRNTPLDDNGFYPYLLPLDNVIIKTLEFLRED